MGKVEKVVVLSVLFLITLILVISLSGPAEETGLVEPTRLGAGLDGEVQAALDPRDAPRRGDELRREPLPFRAAQDDAPQGTEEHVAPAASAPRAEAPAPAAPRERLLSSRIGADPDAENLSALEGTILVTQQGLLDSFLDEYRFYPWRQNDTWQSVAARYYGAGDVALGVERLHRANEGRHDVAPGEKILVPVYDLDDGTSTRPAAVPRRTGATVPAVAGGSAGTYVVADGDSLWKIAAKVYGNGARWKEIFEANGDQLASQDDLRVGQALRIP